MFAPSLSLYLIAILPVTCTARGRVHVHLVNSKTGKVLETGKQ
jgi:hypothetical protein